MNTQMKMPGFVAEVALRRQGRRCKTYRAQADRMQLWGRKKNSVEAATIVIVDGQEVCNGTVEIDAAGNITCTETIGGGGGGGGGGPSGCRPSCGPCVRISGTAVGQKVCTNSDCSTTVRKCLPFVEVGSPF